jgi:hypothetical protein
MTAKQAQEKSQAVRAEYERKYAADAPERVRLMQEAERREKEIVADMARVFLKGAYKAIEYSVGHSCEEPNKHDESCRCAAGKDYVRVSLHNYYPKPASLQAQRCAAMLVLVEKKLHTDGYETSISSDTVFSREKGWETNYYLQISWQVTGRAA